VRLFVSLLILCSVCLGQSSFTVPVGKPAVKEATFTANGKPFSRAAGQSQQPKTIIDTVRMVNGFASLALNSTFTRTEHRTAATSDQKVYATATAVLHDSSKTVYSYSCFPTDGGARIVIKSSDSTDTGKVAVVVYVR
jgi:hypothetical protein